MDKEARFDIYCDSCKNHDVPGFEDPCNDCLNETTVEDTHIPAFHKKEGPYINYLEPDGKTYTRDYRKRPNMSKPTDEELKLYFEKRDDGDYYERKNE